MRVALVVPTMSYTGVYPTFLALSDFPVGFAYLAAALKKAGHEVIGLNPNNDPGYPSARAMLYAKLKKMLDEERPQLVGLGGLCTDYAFLKDAIAIVRSLAPEVPIVCGGGIITHDAETAFTLLKPDFCIIGEGEEVLVLLAEQLAAGNMSFDTIPNLGYWRGGAACFTKSHFAYPPLENRAFPDYSPFDAETMLGYSTVAARSLYRYTRPYPRIMPFVAARGCPFRCTFCVHRHGPGYRTRPMADILAEIAHLYETYRFNILIILDELFAVDKARLREFCQGIMEGRSTHGWDFDWLFQTHANAALGLAELRMAKNAGCFFFSYGMESASPRVLASMNKKSRPEQLAEAISLASEAGMGFGGNFIFGDVAETPATIKETMDFLLGYCLDIHIHVMPVSPYPGSQLYEHCLQQGIVKDKSAFYETIDSVLINMTSMPDAAWWNWIREIVWPLNQMPYVISVQPLEAVRERAAEAPVPLWRVRARCPHCSTATLYREPLNVEPASDRVASFLTGCPSCGRRFRVELKGEGGGSGAVLGRPTSPDDIRAAVSRSLQPLSVSREQFDVLLVYLEFPRWDRARAWGYQATFGIEEGLAANGLSVLTVPALHGLEPGDPSSWLSHLREICSNKEFGQVWIEVVHTALNDALLTYISSLAPVRVGFVGESLQYPPEVYEYNPSLRERRTVVERRLRFMTHVLAADEQDVEWLLKRGVTAAWWLPAIPARFINRPPSVPSYPQALFSGTLYGDRLQWLLYPDLQNLLVKQPSLEDDTDLPAVFDHVNRQRVDSLAAWRPFDPQFLQLHTDTLRQIRQKSLSLWLDGLAQGSAVVNLPSFFQGYAGRVYEGMAAGRPVISWQVPNRPRINRLFEDGTEILLFDKDKPEQLAAQIRRIQNDVSLASSLVNNARNKLLRYHTAEYSVGQILEWVRSGLEPDFGDRELREESCFGLPDDLGRSGSLPSSVHFLLNDICNAKCVFCGGDYFRSTSGRMITLEKFRVMARNLHLERFESVTLAGAGDPLLNRDLVPIIQHINAEYPACRIFITTNGIALSKELSETLLGSCRAASVNISINAATRETYESLMQVDAFDTVCNNAINFTLLRLKYRSDTYLQFSIALLRSNIDELPLLVTLARQLGVSSINSFYCRFYPESIRHQNIESPRYRLDNSASLFYAQELSDRKVMEAKRLAHDFSIHLTHDPLFCEPASQRHCHWTEAEIMVGFDGEIYPCGGGELHFRKKIASGEYDFGNALTQTIEEFWNNESYRAVRISSRHGELCPMIECAECANLMKHDDVRSHILTWRDFEEPHPPAMVSVIVPTHNRPGMLSEAIQSIMDQTFREFEIIVVNDAGEDVSPVIRAFDSPKILYLAHETNKGLAATRNTGIRAASGKYIAYLDDDDTFYPEHLETLVAALEGSDFRVAYTDARRAFRKRDGAGYVTTRSDIPYSEEFDYERILWENFIPVLCVMHEKECVEASGLFDETLKRHEDWDLWIRMSRDFAFVHVPKVTCQFAYLEDGSGMTSGTLPMYLGTCRYIYQKYRQLTGANTRVVQHQKSVLFSINCDVMNFIGERISDVRTFDDIPFGAIRETGATAAQIASVFHAQAAARSGAADHAAELLEKAVAEYPENYPAAVSLIKQYVDAGRPGAALELLSFLQSRNPLDATIAVMMAQLRQAGGVTASIIIPVHGKRPLTQACIAAIRDNTGSAVPYEVIVVDNASADDTAAYLTSLGEGIRVLTNAANLGFAKACNQGGAVARGEYLIFLNNDTVPQPGWLEGLVRGAVEEKADIVGARLLYPDGFVQHAGIAFARDGVPYHIFRRFPGDAGAVNRKRFMKAVTGACMLVRSALFRELGGFDEGYLNGFEDVDLCLRAWQGHWRILYVPESRVVHYEESTPGRKAHDAANMSRFMARWGGIALHDDDSWYAAEGLRQVQGPDGRISIEPEAGRDDGP